MNATPPALARARQAAMCAWKLADDEIEYGMLAGCIDYPLVSEMQRAALYLDHLAFYLYDRWMAQYECACVLPEQSCSTCRETAFVIYQEDMA